MKNGRRVSAKTVAKRGQDDPGLRNSSGEENAVDGGKTKQGRMYCTYQYISECLLKQQPRGQGTASMVGNVSKEQRWR